MSFGDIAAEAMSGAMEGDDLDARIDEALACPCVGTSLHAWGSGLVAPRRGRQE